MRRPEILAPAGDRDALAAALAAGADAVYFGLDDGFNARARAENFPSDGLAEIVRWIHRAGARAYVTLNTLVFEPELPIVEELIRRVAAAGVDAIIVQDPAVALLARAISPPAQGRTTPPLEVHASTQMTASSPMAVGLLRSLGLSRVVVPRELGVDEIRAYRAGTDVELEVFVHGALCVAWSGQCLSSEAWGGRSANRGQCAQACRLPYSLVVDGVTRELGEVEYLLSPKDLVGLDVIGALADIGVASLKIEGRLKGPAYVATAVAQYRAAAAAAVGERAPELPVDVPLDRESLHVAYSRGVSRGFLGGVDHQTLVEGRFPRHRGLPLGRVIAVEGDEVEVVRDPDQRPITGGLARAPSDDRVSDRAPDDRASDDRASDDRASDDRASDDRASDDRASDDRASDDRAPDDRASDDRAPDDRAPDDRASDDRASDDRASDDRASDDRASDDRASDDRASDDRASDDRASDDRASDDRALDDRALDSRTSDGRALDDRPRELLSDVRAGMGVVFDAGTPEQPEQGGPIFAVAATPRGHRLRFGQPGPDLGRVKPGDFVWVTSDPKVTRAGDKAAEAGREALGRIPVELVVRGAVGAPLEVRASLGRPAVTVTRHSATTLAAARNAGITRELIADKLGSFGGTPFHLGELDTTGLASGMHLPVSELKELRRALAAELERAVETIEREVVERSVIEEVRARATSLADRRARDGRASANDAGDPRDGRTSANDAGDPHGGRTSANGDVEAGVGVANPDAELRVGFANADTDVEARVVPLCRTDEQLDAALDAGATEVELDWMELVGLAKAVERARARGARVGVATMRVQKPGEDKIDAHLARLAPDSVLVRSWGSLAYFAALPAAERPVLHGDFSLNVTNSITAGWVLGHGLQSLTAAHDLDREQLLAMLAAAPRGRVAVTVHHHIPTFHTEHCVYAHLLSNGRDYRTCGRPCEQHAVSLRDRVGLVHPVVVDVGCRNTVFNAQAQSAASLVPELLACGVRRLRVELVRETAEETRRLYTAYSQLVAGAIAPADVVRAAAVHEQFGVTRGTMRTLTVLR